MTNTVLCFLQRKRLRTGLIRHNSADGEGIILHRKPYVHSGKTEAVDPVRVLLIGGTGVKGEGFQKGFPLVFGDLYYKLLRAANV